jgi:glycosyltransferase involved in cell wall biosynthesis
MAVLYDGTYLHERYSGIPQDSFNNLVAVSKVKNVSLLLFWRSGISVPTVKSVEAQRRFLTKEQGVLAKQLALVHVPRRLRSVNVAELKRVLQEPLLSTFELPKHTVQEVLLADSSYDLIAASAWFGLRPVTIQNPNNAKILIMSYPWNYRLTGAKSIVRVHDLFPLTHPQMIKKSILLPRIFEATLENHIAYGSHFVFNSESSLRNFSNYFGFNISQRMHVVYCTFPETRDVMEKTSELFSMSSNSKYFIAIGTIEPRKNYSGLIGAFETLRLSKRDVRLIIVGEDGWEQSSVFNKIEKGVLEGWITREKSISRAKLIGLLKQSSAFVTNSIDEGFNIPLSDAARLRKPILATNVGAHREFLKSRPREIMLHSNENELILNLAAHFDKSASEANHTKEYDYMGFEQQIIEEQWKSVMEAVDVA